MEVSPVKGKDELKDGESTESEGKREQWDRKIEFVFACVGFAVGYGNFWRFPFKCFKNGGGWFAFSYSLFSLYPTLTEIDSRSPFGKKSRPQGSES